MTTELRKKRGTVRRSITSVCKRLTEVEGLEDLTEARLRAQRMSTRILELDTEFKSIQHDLIATITEGDDDALTTEQEALDKHDEEIDTLTVRVQLILGRQNPTNDDGKERILSRNLASLERSLRTITDGLEAVPLDGDVDVSLIQQFQEELTDLKADLVEYRNELNRLDLPEDHEISATYLQIKGIHFEACCAARRMVNSKPSATPNPGASKALKVPKLEAPTFDGDVLNWIQFWEQFSISIDQRSNLSDAEKFVYLQQSLKGGTAKGVISGLSGTGKHYSKAIECLKARYDRPRLIHQSHVKSIVEAPSLKEGSGKELRRLHDTMLQHLRALDAADSESLSCFVTSLIQLKLDPGTLFEWQKHTQTTVDVPCYEDLLEFVDLRARASESTSKRTTFKTEFSGKKVSTNVASASGTSGPRCVLCKSERHPLYYCHQFKGLSCEERSSTVKEHNLCNNCLRSGHNVRNCKSPHYCKRCQKPHHTLLHVDTPDTAAPAVISSNAAPGVLNDTLLMTCQVHILAPDGSRVKARALLDSASSSSFISERLVQGLGLRRQRSDITVSGVAGLCSSSPLRSVVNVTITPTHSSREMSLSAVVSPRVTSDLPLEPVKTRSDWTHLDNLTLADPQFDIPGRIDMLLGVDVYVESLLHGRRSGPPGSPTAFQTVFGWVLAGRTQPTPSKLVVSHHISVNPSADDLLRRFWEVEEPATREESLSMEDQGVMNHFKQSYQRSHDGRFVVPLPRRTGGVKQIGESRSQALRRFTILERSLRRKDQFTQLDEVVQEYFKLGHAEIVPREDLEHPKGDVFYLPIHAVSKVTSTTTKLRAVFDASAKSSTGVSLNDCLLVGPTVHAPLIDVLMRFRQHRVAITTDVSKMYRAINLANQDQDLHRFLWRSAESETICDYRMTRLTFGVSASSFIANMCVRQNALNHAHEFPAAAKSVNESFYVDDGLTGADNERNAIMLMNELDSLFALGGFQLHKWNSSSPAVLSQMKPELRDNQNSHEISDVRESTKTLGLEWRTQTDQFHLTVTQTPQADKLTKRALVSNIAKVFDVLGWFSPAVIKVKILLQRLWEEGIDWDDVAPDNICESWKKWSTELSCLANIPIPRCYFPKTVHVIYRELHGFSDASEEAYAAVVYLRMVDSNDDVHITLVAAKTKVAPIKRLTIPRLELCGALILSKLITQVRNVLNIPVSSVTTWTDSTVVIDWLTGNPRRFKTYVGNRVAQIIDQVPAERWKHVAGVDNPADCASRGLYPNELVNHPLWWNGPKWLSLTPSEWPKSVTSATTEYLELSDEIITHTSITSQSSVIPLDRFSSFERLQRVTGWIFRFIKNCRTPPTERIDSPHLRVSELHQVEHRLCTIVQADCFEKEIKILRSKCQLPKGNRLLSLTPFLDSENVLRVGGRQMYANASYSKIHPIILHANHNISRLLLATEHKRLLHGGPTLIMASLSRRFHILRVRQAVRKVTQQCVTCRRWSAKPQPPMLGQLPIERLSPGPIFDKSGLDYAGPFYIKYGHVRKPVIVKAYVCVFVSLTVKAVHLEMVTDLTSEAFIACLRRFIGRRGCPSLLWSDHGTNFIGANREIKEMFTFLEEQTLQRTISEFCSANRIEWKFIPQRSPHFGGIWEAAVKSFKGHFKRIVGDVKLTYEEASTVLIQIECCLNSRPLGHTGNSGDDVEVLTPGHFLIGQPLAALPDPAMSYRKLTLLKRWHLCQYLVRHFWKRWSCEYLSTMQRSYKWQNATRNLSIDDVVILIDDELIPTKWPLARIVKVYPGQDGVVRVADVKTFKGVYRRPVHKLALLPCLKDETDSNSSS